MSTPEELLNLAIFESNQDAAIQLAEDQNAFSQLIENVPEEKFSFNSLLQLPLNLDEKNFSIPQKLHQFALYYPALVDQLMRENQDTIRATFIRMRELFVELLDNFSKTDYNKDIYEQLKKILNAGLLRRISMYQGLIAIDFEMIMIKLLNKYPSLILNQYFKDVSTHYYDDGIARFILTPFHNKLDSDLYQNKTEEDCDQTQSIEENVQYQFLPGSCIRGVRLFEQKTSSRYPHRVAEIAKHLTDDRKETKDKKIDWITYASQKKTASKIVISAANAINHPRSYRSLWYITRDEKTNDFYKDTLDKLCYVDDQALQALKDRIEENTQPFSFRFEWVGGDNLKTKVGNLRVPARVKKIHTLLDQLLTQKKLSEDQRASLLRDIALNAVEGIQNGKVGQTQSTRDFYQLVIDTLIQKQIPAPRPTI